MKFAKQNLARQFLIISSSLFVGEPAHISTLNTNKGGGILLLIVVFITMAFAQEKIKDIYGFQWVLVKYSDPLSDSIITIDQTYCISRFSIKFERKNKFITFIDDKWRFVGKYKEQTNDDLKNFSKIHENIYLPNDDKCKLSNPPIFILKVMLMGVFKYKVKGDILTLHYFKKDSKNGIIEFVKKNKSE